MNKKKTNEPSWIKHDQVLRLMLFSRRKQLNEENNDEDLLELNQPTTRTRVFFLANFQIHFFLLQQQIQRLWVRHRR